MRVVREEQTLILSVNFVESRVLLGVLRALVSAYRLKPADLDSKARAVWYSTRGCETVKMSADETAEWLAALHECKGARLERLEQWAAQLSAGTAHGHRIRLGCSDAPAFMTAINDYRLLAAARHDIGQAEMDGKWLDPAGTLSPERQQALIEIEFLAWMIEMILHGLSENA
jgi:hypothetical protein